MFWKTAATIAKIADKAVTAVFIILILLLTGYGAYTIWVNEGVANGAFLSEELARYSPTESAKDNNDYSLFDLMELNSDIIGWITVEGTNINYPLLQGETDTQYLNRDAFGEFALSGSIFLSCTNSPDFSDPYNLVYGHHMANGAMFGDLDGYAYGDYLEQFPEGKLYMAENGEVVARNIEFFCVLNTDAYDEAVFYTGADVSNEDRISVYHATALHKREATPTGQLISLVTCADSHTNGRIALIGYLQ